MGLHVSSISDLPLSEERKYIFICVGLLLLEEPINEALNKNTDRIASFAPKMMQSWSGGCLIVTLLRRFYLGRVLMVSIQKNFYLR